MRLLLTFIIFILGGFYTFGKENCCEQCCEYLRNCCKKGKGEVKNENNVGENKKEGEDNVKGNKEENKKEGKGEVQEEFYLKKAKVANSEEIKKLVNTNWYDSKEKEASFFFYEKINGAVNQNLNENDVIKVKKNKNGFTIDENFITEKGDTKKWALFEIIYKKKGEEEKNKENETKYLYCSDIESINYFGIFESCEQHISISVIACNTSNVTDMHSMLSNCYSLQELDLTNFNTGNVKDMHSMFLSCKALTKIIFGDKFNTDNVTNMNGMFGFCSSLQELDLKNFNTGNVKDMGDMFLSCASLQTVTFNKNLNNKIIQQLEILGLTEVKKEGNKLTLKKNN